MKAIDIEIAMMEFLGIRQNLIVPNVSWGIVSSLHECDLLSLSNSNYATEIEIKVSKSDLLKDKEKMHGHFHNHIARLYFAVPQKLEDLALFEIPERAGLYSVSKDLNYQGRYKVKLIRQCKRNTNAVQWSDDDRVRLARLGALRILGMKKKIAKLQTELKQIKELA